MFTVFLVDDETNVLTALSRLLRTKGYLVRSFTCPRQFLAHHDATVPGCAVLDVSMPGLDGLELQQALIAEGSHRPVIFITGNGDVPTSVRAMKAGAIDFLMKPVRAEALFAAIDRAEQRDAEFRKFYAELTAIKTKVSTLTRRERQVLTHVVTERMNKQIAGDLGTVEKTIKIHRHRMMTKLGVRTVPDLVRLAGKIGI